MKFQGIRFNWCSNTIEFIFYNQKDFLDSRIVKYLKDNYWTIENDFLLKDSYKATSTLDTDFSDEDMLDIISDYIMFFKENWNVRS